jgi:phosphoglucosamine mutase
MLRESDQPLSAASTVFESYPQVLINVPVRSKEALASADRLWAEVHRAEEDLGDEGRVLVRPSGTEPLVRVMVEAVDAERAAKTAEDLAAAIQREVG